MPVIGTSIAPRVLAQHGAAARAPSCSRPVAPVRRSRTPAPGRAPTSSIRQHELVLARHVPVERHRREPAALGHRAIDTAARPSSSAISTAASTISSTVQPSCHAPKCMAYTLVYGIHNRGRGPDEGLRRHAACSTGSTCASKPARCSRCSARTAPGRRRPSASSRRCSRPTAGRPASPATTSSRDPNAVRAAISLTAQEAAVDGMLTGAENLRMMARLRGVETHGRADELLERFDLVEAADRRVATYSGGMRRRLDLAMSLVVKPAGAVPRRADDRPGPAQPARRVGGGPGARATTARPSC